MEIHIEDNFLLDAEQARKDVLDAATFEGVEYEGHFYSGVDTGTPLDVQDAIELAVESEVRFHMAFWRLSKKGEDTPHPIHADNGYAQWAGLLYMTPTEEFGGTALWRHKETEDYMVPEDADEDYVEKITADARDESKWDMTALLRAKFNRFVSYPTKYYHSRYPFFSENYGDTREDGRLVWVVFYDKV